MAIDLLTFRKLLELAPRLPRGSRALVMGRQNFLLPNAIGRMARQKPVYQTMLNQYGHDIDLERIVDVDGYCDTLFDFLGFAETDYMDVSDYEGANVLHDLNHPVPRHCMDNTILFWMAAPVNTSSTLQKPFATIIACCVRGGSCWPSIPRTTGWATASIRSGRNWSGASGVTHSAIEFTNVLSMRSATGTQAVR